MRTAKISTAIILPALLLAACGEREVAPPVPEEESLVARAPLTTADGTNVGEVIVAEGDSGLLLTLTASNMTKGEHGVHVHMTGQCDAPDFASAGGHWNPANTQHGLENPDGAHAGDLPNLLIAEDGTGKVETVIDGASLTDGEMALMDDDGAAFIIHEGPDDMKTDPSGDSGGRIACGVFSMSTGGAG